MVCRKVDSVSWGILLDLMVKDGRQIARADQEGQDEEKDEGYGEEMKVGVNKRKKGQLCGIKHTSVSFTL